MKGTSTKFVFEPTAFEYVNSKAGVVIVGITPGNSQLDGSREGMTPREVKRKYAFAGKMRPNLIKMLDYIGVNTLLGIDSCNTLWEEDFDRVDMTSLLVEATYEIKKDGKKEMFRHAEKIAKSEALTGMLEEGFVRNCSRLEKPVLFISCGLGVYEVLMRLVEEQKISGRVVGIAHPSGANMKCIQCYLGFKEPSTTSMQRYVDKAREAKELIDSMTSD